MLEIAVCENEQTYVDIVEAILNQHSSEFEETLNIHKFTDGKQLCEYLQSHEVDQLYLDIEMPGMSGIQVAEYIRYTLNEYNLALIFMTGTTEYDRELFEFQTFGFLEKPMDENKLVRICTRAWVLSEKFDAQEGEENSLHLSNKEEAYQIQYQKILYIQKEGHHIIVFYYHVHELKYCSARRTIKEMEKVLPKSRFVKISSSSIVNMRYIQSVQKDEVVLTDCQRLSASRDYRQEVKRKVAGYVMR